MKKIFLFFLSIILLYFSTPIGAEATPLELTENADILNSNWTDGEIYSFLGSNINLGAGQYDLTFNINGKIWQKGDGDGWETNDKIIVKVFLNDSLFGSTIGSGWRGQLVPFDLSLALNFDLSADGILDIYAYSDVSSTKERWLLVDATLGGNYTGFNYEENRIVPTPEPTTMMLLVFGLIGLGGFSRKKISNK